MCVRRRGDAAAEKGYGYHHKYLHRTGDFLRKGERRSLYGRAGCSRRENSVLIVENKQYNGS